MNKSQFVIVGGGPAGITALEILRKHQPEASITLVSHERPPLYARMATPYLLSNVTDEEGILLRDPNFLKENKINALFGTRVTSVNTAAKTITLSDGVQHGYGKLLLATGSSPTIPPVKGIDQPGILYNWTREDAKHILAKSQEASRVVIIGSGFIGLQLVHPLLQKGLKISIIEIASQILPTMLDKQGAEIVEAFLHDRGVDVFTSSEVEEIYPEGEKGKTVKLKSGEQLSADLVLVAAGVRPNLDFIANANLEVDRGILVDAQMKTNQPDVFAAGDIAQAFDLISEKAVVHALWPVAVEQGRVAGYNMAGKAATYPGGLNYNTLDILHLTTARIGILETEESMEIITHFKADRNQYRRYSFLHGRMVGCLMVGNIEGIGMIKGLIQSKRDLTRYLPRLKKDPFSIDKIFLSANWVDSTLWKP